MDTELVNEIRGLTKKINGFIELNKGDSIKAINMVAEKYIKNRANTWWWEELAQNSITLNYEDDDGLFLLKNVVGNDNTLVKLFITDDEPEPWPVFQGEIKMITDIISEQRFFEYFITANDFSWLIFDTHHNSLIVLGDLFKAAESILASIKQ